MADLPPRLELECQVNDAFNAALLVDLAIDAVLRQKIGEEDDGNVTLLLTSDQVDALTHAGSLVLGSSRAAREAFYALPADRRSRRPA